MEANGAPVASLWLLVNCLVSEERHRTGIQLEELEARNELVRWGDHCLLSPLLQQRARGAEDTTGPTGKVPGWKPLERPWCDTTTDASLLFTEVNICMERFWESATAVRAALPEEAARCVRDEVSKWAGTVFSGAGEAHGNGDCEAAATPPESGLTREGRRRAPLLLSSSSSVLEMGRRCVAQRGRPGGASPYQPRLLYANGGASPGEEGKEGEEEALRRGGGAGERNEDEAPWRSAVAALQRQVECLSAIVQRSTEERSRDGDGKKSLRSENARYHAGNLPSVEAAIDEILSASAPFPTTTVATAATTAARDPAQSLCHVLLAVKHLYDTATGTCGGSLRTILSLPTSTLPAPCVEACVAYLADASCDSSAASVHDSLAAMAAPSIRHPPVSAKRRKELMIDEEDGEGSRAKAAATLWASYRSLQGHALAYLLLRLRTSTSTTTSGIATSADATAGDRDAVATTIWEEKLQQQQQQQQRRRQERQTALEALAGVFSLQQEDDAASHASTPRDVGSQGASPPFDTIADGDEPEGEVEAEEEATVAAQMKAWWPSKYPLEPHRTIPTPYDSLFPLPEAVSAFSPPPPLPSQTASSAPPARFFSAPARQAQRLGQAYMSEEANPTLRGPPPEPHLATMARRYVK